ncbi:MAG: GDSL-type esterase/lipase family protein [Acidimicrobiales bacterium]
MFRRSLFVAVLTVTLVLLSGCGGGADPTLEATADTGSTVASTALDPGTSAATDTGGLSLPTAGTATTGPDVSATDNADPSPTAPDAPATSPSMSTPATAAGPRPDCRSACTIVMEGDSLAMGLGDWLCRELGTTGGCINSGTGGNRVDQMIETARGDVDLHAGAGGNDVLILWGGTNDLWQQHHSPDPTANAEATYGFIADYIAERRTKGWDYIFVMTNPPANPDLVKGSDHLNELIRANSAGADAVIDTAAEPKLADPFDSYLRASDGVHYTDPGRQIVVDGYLVPAIRSLTG